MSVPAVSPASNRCLITGATGFIGSHLGRLLARQGWDVTALARRSSDRSALEGAAVRWRVGDVTDPASLPAALEGQRILFHCAGMTKALNPGDLFRVNAEGTRHLLEACAALPLPPERIVVLSSQAAAGPALPDGRPRSEDDPLEPVSLYGQSKAEGERICHPFMDRLSIAILRPVVVYGPRERDVFTLFRSLSRCPILLDAGAAPVVFQAIHSLDLVKAMVRVALAPDAAVRGQTFFVGHPVPCDSVEFGRSIGRAVGRSRVAVIRVPLWIARCTAAASERIGRWRGKPSVLSKDKIREMAAAPWLCETGKLTEATGYCPRIAAPGGLRATARWYRQHGWL